MSEQNYDENRNGEYHYTGDQLNQTTGNQSNEHQPAYREVQTGPRPHPAPKKTKKPLSMGKKWAIVIAMALVFGLVAGSTMVGVNAIGDLVFNRNDRAAQLTQTETTENADTAGESSGSSGTVAEVAANAMPSLVTISTMTVEQMRSFFGGTQQYEVQGAGTGVIVGENDKELLIATNYHVVEGATSLSVGFIDEHSVEAAVKGTDVNNDLAVVAVKLSDIPDETMKQIKIATIGDSDTLQLGDQVVAIGNALGYGQSVTSGYVSALDRDLTLTYGDGTTIEYEAKSSGSSTGASVDNIGFAIPIDKAQGSLQDMMNMETRAKVEADQASYIGIRGSDVSAEAIELYNVPAGAVVVEVVENGPAAKAGIREGDIITELDGRTISGMSQLQQTLEYYAAGEKVEVVVQRSGGKGYEEKTVSVTLGSAKEMQNQ